MDPELRFIGTWFSDLLVLVPPTPVLDVCAVYDVMNGTLQIIESNWNEVVCEKKFSRKQRVVIYLAS